MWRDGAGLRLGVMCCSVAWCGVAWCGVAWCGVVWCGGALDQTDIKDGVHKACDSVQQCVYLCLFLLVWNISKERVGTSA